MVKNILMLFFVLLLAFFITKNNVSAMRDKEYIEFTSCDAESNFLDSIGLDKLRNKFFDKFKLFDEKKEENRSILITNRELNREIKEKLKENKSVISQEIWKEIRNYKNEINDVKISTREKVKVLIDNQKNYLRESNYSDESIEDFINVLINAQNLKRDSMEFEKKYLHKINDLI